MQVKAARIAILRHHEHSSFLLEQEGKLQWGHNRRSNEVRGGEDSMPFFSTARDV